MSVRHTIPALESATPKERRTNAPIETRAPTFFGAVPMIFRMSPPHLVGRRVSRVLLLLMSALAAVNALAQSDPTIPSGDIRIHYFRSDGNYSGWTVYAFDNTTENTGNYVGRAAAGVGVGRIGGD